MRNWEQLLRLPLKEGIKVYSTVIAMAVVLIWFLYYGSTLAYNYVPISRDYAWTIITGYWLLLGIDYLRLPGEIQLKNWRHLFQSAEFLLLLTAAVIFVIEHTLGTWNFLTGYSGYVDGGLSTPITPYSNGGAFLVIAAITILLGRSGKRYSEALIIGMATALVSLTSFEFVWNLFLLGGHPITSWFGLGPFWTYAIAFIVLDLLWFVGFRYWKIGKVSIILLVAFPVSFLAWYLFGYPQPWYSSTIDAAYLWNVGVKLLSFGFFMAPYTWIFQTLNIHGRSSGLQRGWE